jgi:hypothetical protein
MAQDPTDSHGNLFPIFLLALVQFFLFPITLFRVGGWIIDCVYGDPDKSKAAAASASVAAPTDASSEWGKAAAAHAARNRPTALRKLGGLFRGFNLYVVIFWGISALLCLYIGMTAGAEHKVFDPYAVLQVPVGADAAAVKKAYRSLSLQYHPDKNPDPEVGLAPLFTLTSFYCSQNTPIDEMTAGMVCPRDQSDTPGGVERQPVGSNHQLMMTAGIVLHGTNRVTPGSECRPTRGRTNSSSSPSPRRTRR